MCHHQRGHYLQLSQKVASFTHGFVGADLQNLCKHALLRAIQASMPVNEAFVLEQMTDLVVTWDHFVSALAFVHPAILNEYNTKVSPISIYAAVFSSCRWSLFSLKALVD